MADRPSPAYDGDEPYVFVSYSHEDHDLAYGQIRWLQDQGFNVWWDEGISPGAAWRGELADALTGATVRGVKYPQFTLPVPPTPPRPADAPYIKQSVDNLITHFSQIVF